MVNNKNEDFKLHFCGLATQYYVAARLAAMAAMLPIYGNLFHHAIEMYLKAALVGTLTLKKMSQTPYSHNITKLSWAPDVRQGAADAVCSV